MNNPYYEVIEDTNEHPLPYAFYRLAIRWNVEKVAGYNNSNGYILQKVHFDVDVPGVDNTPDYYEAWKVSNGSCDSKFSYDDKFELHDPCFATNLTGSIGRRGKICYETTVYWIDKQKHASWYGVIDGWPEGGVPMANQLKSAYVKNVPEDLFLGLTYVCQRKYIHQYDCTKPDAVQKSIEHFYAQVLVEDKDFALKSIHDVLSGTKYEVVLEKIIAKYNLQKPSLS